MNELAKLNTIISSKENWRQQVLATTTNSNSNAQKKPKHVAIFTINSHSDEAVNDVEMQKYQR
jgi:hypothetical protein